MSSINLKRLSEELGLSISSVSKALRDSYEISAETKKRVLAMAEKLNYQPNPFASSLRRKKSITIAVVIPEIANNFFALAIDGIQMVAQQKGYHVLTYLTHENFTNEESTIKHLQGGRVDGVLISLCRDTDSIKHLTALHDTGIPLVFFDRVPEIMDCPTVTTDDYDSGFKATEHLIKAGCKKIACFATVEKLAISTYYVCNDIKLKIPQQIKIISFSNLRTASLLAPSLSTITQPAFEIGKESASLLFRMIEKKTFGNRIDKIVLKSSLIERDSSK